MKILIAINQARVLYDFKRELVAALLERGDEVLLSFEDDFRADYFRQTSARVIPTPIDPRGLNPLRDLKLCAFYRELLEREQPDVVLTFTVNGEDQTRKAEKFLICVGRRPVTKGLGLEEPNIQ